MRRIFADLIRANPPNPFSSAFYSDREVLGMPESPFVHLHCHSHYSLLDGANRVPELVAHVKKLGMNACAVTDHGNLFGAIEFYQACRAAGINPVVGCEVYIAPGKR